MIEREIFYDGLLVVTRCTGKVSGDDLIRSAHWMIQNYGDLIKPGFSQIFDALNIDEIDVSSEDIHRVAHVNLNHGRDRGRFSMAIIACEPYPQTLAKLYKILSTAADINVELFCDVDEAFSWLLLNSPELVSAELDKVVVGYA